MLDDPEKTERLLAALKASLPFVVHLTPSLAQHLRAQHVDVGAQNRQIVSEVSYGAMRAALSATLFPRMDARC